MVICCGDLRIEMKKLIFTVLFAVIFAFKVFANNPPGGGCEPEDPNCLDPVPLDTGVIFLLIAGIVFGLKKIRDHKRELQNLQSAE